MGGYTNSTHLALIPKENQPSNFSRFCPISLCNSSYKIFAKILTARLKPLLPMIISKNQGGFMENRQISDSILLVQEAIHSIHTRNEKGFILKLDLVNAFDRVRHSFLFAALQKMCFATLFLDLIRACIIGPWIAPLVNGRPGPTFQYSNLVSLLSLFISSPLYRPQPLFTTKWKVSSGISSGKEGKMTKNI